MATSSDDLTVIDERLKAMTGSAERFGTALTGALRAAVVEGRDLDDVLRRMLLQLSSAALGEALAPLSRLIGGLAGDLLGSLGGAIGGGVAAAAAGSGGEADGARALPGAGASASRVTVVFNVSTPDAESFRRSEAQLGGMLARAVGRGRRGL